MQKAQSHCGVWDGNGILSLGGLGELVCTGVDSWAAFVCCCEVMDSMTWSSVSDKCPSLSSADWSHAGLHSPG